MKTASPPIYSQLPIENHFFRIQKEFLSCTSDEYCSSLCKFKEKVADHGWYYTPPPEYIGKKYDGIVMVGLRPGFPVERGYNPLVRNSVLTLLANTTRKNAVVTNAIIGEFLELRMKFTKMGYVRFQEWQLDHSRIAFLNIYKCRTYNHYDFKDNPAALAPCIGRYFLRQMLVLQPKLVIYFFQNVVQFLEELGIEPSFGGEYIVLTDWGKVPTEESGRKLRNKLRKIYTG